MTRINSAHFMSIANIRGNHQQPVRVAGDEGGSRFHAPLRKRLCTKGIPAECRNRPARIMKGATKSCFATNARAPRSMMKARMENERELAAFQAL
jgi:hypothetical protein